MGDFGKKLNNAKDIYLKAEKTVFNSSKWKIWSIMWLVVAVFFFGWNISLISKGVSARSVEEKQPEANVVSDENIDASNTKVETADTENSEITTVQNESSASDYVVQANGNAETTARSNTSGKTYKLFFDVKCAENLFFNKDDIEILIDGQRVGYVPHGWESAGFVNVSEGEHVIKLSSSSNYTRSILVDKDATFSCSVTVDFSELDISDYSYSEGISSDADVFNDIPGTYYGAQGSGLVIFNDLTAEHYESSFEDEVAKGCYWFYKDGMLNIKLSRPNVTVFARMNNDDSSSFILASKSSSWREEEYIKVSDETAALSVGEYRNLIASGEKKAQISKVVASIDVIGTVDKNSGDAIKNARTLYEGLSSEDKSQIGNIGVLEAAEASYRTVMKAEIEKAIDGIGEVSLDSEGSIIDIQKQYNLVDEETKKSIENYDTLVQAEETLSQLKVQNVTALISEINVDKLSLDDENAVSSAEREFNRLSKEEQELVENAAVITDAKTKISDLKQAEIERKKAEKEKALNDALAKLTKEEDKVTDITYYKPSTYPKYLNNKTFALPYLAVQGDNVTVRMKLDFYGSTWLWWHTITFAIDDYKYTKKYYDITRDIDNSGNVVEFIDVECGNEELVMLSKIADSNETIVRFQGDDYKKDLTLSSKDKKAIGEVMEAYRQLKAR